MRLLVKINLLKSFKVLKGMLYLEGMIQKIKLQKEQYALQIELGNEVFIPTELSQDDFPMSFRYYDPILNVLDDTISNERKELFFIRNQLNVRNFK
jgi:hypothetical protein